MVGLTQVKCFGWGSSPRSDGKFKPFLKFDQTVLTAQNIARYR